MFTLRRIVGTAAAATTAAASSQFDRLADTYDMKIDKEERRMGLLKSRKELFDSGVSGDVLEIGAGTGRNLPFIQPHLESGAISRVVFVDNSAKMIDQLNAKLETALSPEHRARAVAIVDDATSLPFEDESFDSCVSTFTLCSVDLPLTELHELGRVLKPNGKILMLEHGRSSWFLPLNWYLDSIADTHRRNWGCTFNRDLHAVLSHAMRDDEQLELLQHKTRHFGTTHMIVLRKKKQQE
jgi:methyltransferase OMS1, mitochondrial